MNNKKLDQQFSPRSKFFSHFIRLAFQRRITQRGFEFSNIKLEYHRKYELKCKIVYSPDGFDSKGGKMKKKSRDTASLISVIVVHRW